MHPDQKDCILSHINLLAKSLEDEANRCANRAKLCASAFDFSEATKACHQGEVYRDTLSKFKILRSLIEHELDNPL